MGKFKRSGRIEKEIVYGFLILGGFLLIHRYISNELIKGEDEEI